MSPVSDQNVRAIEQLNPYCSPWTIKAIIDSKGDMRTWNKPNSSGKLFSVTLKVRPWPPQTPCRRRSAAAGPLPSAECTVVRV